MGAYSIFFSLLISLGATHNSYAKTAEILSLDDKIRIAHQRCNPRTSNEPVLYRNDVYTDRLHDLDFMAEVYQKTYQSTRRLPGRAYFEPSTQEFITSKGKDSVVLPTAFLKSLILHIENTLKLKHADFVFFPDMGHSHLLVPLDYYNQLPDTPNGTWYERLNQILKDNPKGLKSLYHTAEHLNTHVDRARTQLVDDHYIQWRFYTRNPVLDSKGNIEIHTNLEKSKANTVHGVAGYRFVAGVNISANQNGCFPFENANGAIEYFDVSAWDLSTDCSRSDCNSEF